MSSLLLEGNQIVLNTPYNQGVVSDLKATIPATDRRWDSARKVWLVAPKYGAQLAKIIFNNLGEFISVPAIKQAKAETEMKILEVHYIGITKLREGYDESVALGLLANGNWGAIFPERALTRWFLGMDTMQSETTLYGLLGVDRACNPDTLKAGFRRMARQWHPDVCTEPDAAQRFVQIKDAYDLLSNPNKRARYDAGLALEARMSAGRNIAMSAIATGYKPPLRCGYIMAEGIETLGRFNVSKILTWEDITNSAGQTLVTSWPVGAQQPTRRWA